MAPTQPFEGVRILPEKPKWPKIFRLYKKSFNKKYSMLSKQLFKKAKKLLSAKRNNLKSKNVDMFCFINIRFSNAIDTNNRSFKCLLWKEILHVKEAAYETSISELKI